MKNHQVIKLLNALEATTSHPFGVPERELPDSAVRDATAHIRDDNRVAHPAIPRRQIIAPRSSLILSKRTH